VEGSTVQTASVVINRASGCTATVPATRQPDGTYKTDAVLLPGDTAEVAAAGIHDTFGEYNGAASAIVGIGATTPVAAAGPCPPDPVVPDLPRPLPAWIAIVGLLGLAAFRLRRARGFLKL
jgi:hypothetical protein